MENKLIGYLVDHNFINNHRKLQTYIFWNICCHLGYTCHKTSKNVSNFIEWSKIEKSLFFFSTYSAFFGGGYLIPIGIYYSYFYSLW